MLRIHRIIPRTKVEGPGVRFCIWVQGCHNRCPGCFATDTWDPTKGTCVPVETVIAQLRTETAGLEGITFLGGEPMEQADKLSRVAEAARAEGLSVITFTGCRFEELQQRRDPGIHRLLALTDLLIDGPYLEQRPEKDRPLVGSENQRFLFLTDRYCQKDIDGIQNGFEVRIGEKGQVQINGMGDIKKLQQNIVGGSFI